MDKKPTQKKKLRGQYLINAMDELALGGDAYTFDDGLYKHCAGMQNHLPIETFLADKAFLIRKGIIYQEGQRLYMTKTWRYETAAAKALAGILTTNQLEAPCLPETLEVGGLILSAEQKEAVRMALGHRLSIILGSAGTGKTSLIQALVRNRKRYLPNWVLCAPTGKAARNLTERSALQARTVHSALGKIPDEDFLTPVAWHFTGLVVVDEASMMTLEMLAGILSIAPSGSCIVLVGDPHQLLSVGSGNVLPDLLALGVPCTKLEVCHRQDDESGALLRNVREFRNCHGLNDFTFDDSFAFRIMDDEEKIKSYICEEVARRYLAGERVQVLSPFNRSGKLSVWE
ncbi:MAG: ATP-dependent RecD-like helicase, partial [Bacillota bacterium]|nr:ATP-dependent RecD-like helicase [Bacillota bacterium]